MPQRFIDQHRPGLFIHGTSPGDKHSKKRLQIPAKYSLVFFKGDAHGVSKNLIGIALAEDCLPDDCFVSHRLRTVGSTPYK